MGFFDDLAAGFNKMTGGVDEQLLATGVLARGEVLSMDLSGTTVQVMNGLVERTVTFTLNVLMDGQAPFQATCSQRVQEVLIPQLQQPGVVLAVRVDPADHSKVAIDFNSEVPNVTVAAGQGHDTAAWVLANGTDANVVLVANQPMGVTSSSGDPVQALTLTIDKGAESYQIQVGNGVPNSALPLLFPGSKLYAKIGDGPNDVVVDWARGARS